MTTATPEPLVPSYTSTPASLRPDRAAGLVGADQIFCGPDAGRLVGLLG